MNLFDIIYTGLSPYFAIRFLKKYRDIKVAIDYVSSRFNATIKNIRTKRQIVILHGASIGETKSLLSLKDAIIQSNNDIDVVITTATHTAYNLLRHNYSAQNHVAYMPFDFYSKVRKFLQYLKPSVLIIAEQEIWPNLILNASALGIKIFLVNFRIKPQKAFLYNLSLYKYILKNNIDKYFCVNDITIQKLIDIGIPQSKIERIENMKFIPYINKFIPRNSDKLDLVSLLSIHKGEEKYLEDICLKLRSKYNLKFLCIPRHINYSEYYLKFFSKQFKTVMLNDFDYQKDKRLLDNNEFFVINKFGIVDKILSLTKYTILGGTFIKVGGHNILEPIFYSNKVLIGSYYHNIVDEVEKGEKSGLVYKYGKVFDTEDFLKYSEKEIAQTCQSFFSNIENPMNKIMRGLKEIKYSVCTRGIEEMT